MIKNYFVTAFRNLVKNKTYSIINIVGLAIGLASSIMILLYLKNELTFDNMHQDAEVIYRVGFDLSMPQGKENSAVITAAVAPSLLEEFPEVESVCRLRSPAQGFFGYQDVNFETDQVSFADSTFFNFFSFKLVSGTPSAVLNKNYTVVLTESLSRKIFGDEDPIGKVLNWNNTYEVIVSGISEDCPQNSSIQYTALISFGTLYDQGNLYMGWNGGNQFFNYIKLYENAELDGMEAKLTDFLEKHINYMYRPHGWLINLVFDRMDRMHLHGIVTNVYGSGDVSKLRIIAMIGLFVLLIAVFNFINLSTARSSKRSVEIGIRKVLGAQRSRISAQFLGEATIYSLIAFVISLILIEIFQPQFVKYIGDYELYTFSNIPFIIGVVVFTVIVGLLAGSYPAYFIAGFKPVQSLKGESLNRSGKPYLRNVLVVLQFVISVAITSYTIVMIMQLTFFQKKDLGFNAENTLVIRMPSSNAIQSYPALKTSLQGLADVKSVSSSSGLLGVQITQNGYLPEGLESPKLYNFCAIDEDLLHALDIELIEGRTFSKEYSTDDSAYVINEAMAKELGWNNPIGKKIARNGWKHVIGVVQDFHFQNVRREIKPLILGYARLDEHDFVHVKLNTSSYQTSIENIESVYKRLLPDEPFNYEFYKNHLKDNYSELRKSIRIMSIFAIMAIIIACMGLYGLAMFTVEKRQREIGVRKVFGADTMQIGKLVVLDFLKWVFIANVVSFPISYYYSLQFLDTFPYSINLNAIPFIATFLLSSFIALATIIFQILKLSKVNPVSTLKYE